MFGEGRRNGQVRRTPPCS